MTFAVTLPFHRRLQLISLTRECFCRHLPASPAHLSPISSASPFRNHGRTAPTSPPPNPQQARCVSFRQPHLGTPRRPGNRLRWPRRPCLLQNTCFPFIGQVNVHPHLLPALPYSSTVSTPPTRNSTLPETPRFLRADIHPHFLQVPPWLSTLPGLAWPLNMIHCFTFSPSALVLLLCCCPLSCRQHLMSSNAQQARHQDASYRSVSRCRSVSLACSPSCPTLSFRRTQISASTTLLNL